MMEEFSDEKRSKVLFYITGSFFFKYLNYCYKIMFLGSFKPPSDGFKNFRIKLLKTGENIENLPIAHTCFLRIDIPDYNSKEMLVKKIDQALEMA